MAPETALGDDATATARPHAGLVVSPELGEPAWRVGPRVDAYGLVPSASLSPALSLEVGARASAAYHALSASRGLRGAGYVFEGVPVLRVALAARPALRPWAEYGIGLAWMRFTEADRYSPTEGGQVPVLHCGVGLDVALTSSLRLVAELRMRVYPKRGSNVFLAPALGVEL